MELNMPQTQENKEQPEQGVMNLDAQPELTPQQKQAVQPAVAEPVVKQVKAPTQMPVIEAMNVERIANLIKLAALRQVSVPQLMNDLGIESPGYVS